MVVWHYEERQECGSHEVHREEIAAVGVSAGDEYVASLGGLSDGYLVLWHIPTKTPICSAFPQSRSVFTFVLKDLFEFC